MAFEKNDNYKNLGFPQLGEYVAKQREELKGIFDAHTDSGNGQYRMNEEVIKEIRERNDFLGEVTKHWEGMREVDSIFQKNREELTRLNTEPVKSMPFSPNNGTKPETKAEAKSLGELFINSDEYKQNRVNGINARFGWDVKGYEFKTTMTTAAGFAPANDRTDIVSPYPTRTPMLQDYIPSITTDLDTVKYMEETTFTNNAAEAAENAALAESAIAYTERSQPVELVGTFLPVTEQQLEIAEAIRGTIDQRLLLMLAQREESQMIAGNGSTPNLRGFLNASNLQTQAKGSDSVPTAAYKLITKLRGGAGAGFVEPNLFIFHPNDWQDIRTLQDANGNYIWGSPAEAGPERLWGKAVLVTTAITENTGLAGDFQMYSTIWRKRGARIDVGMQNDDFVKNKLTLKVTSRLALVIYRGSAYGTVTSI